MRTDDLVRAIAADTAPEPTVGMGLALALVAGGALALGVVVAILGVQPDLAATLLGVRGAAKQVWPVWLAMAAGGAALRLAVPGRPSRGFLAAVAVVPAILAVGVVLELRVLPAAEWRGAMMGESARQCLALVPALSLPILPGVLWALRRGASPHPAASGALAGLLSGATATAVYALHCTEVSPLFYAVWYVLAILVVTLIGMALGRTILRW
jgi:hypothetical protein